MRLGRRGALVLTTLAAAILVTTGDAAVTDETGDDVDGEGGDGSCHLDDTGGQKYRDENNNNNNNKQSDSVGDNFNAINHSNSKRHGYNGDDDGEHSHHDVTLRPTLDKSVALKAGSMVTTPALNRYQLTDLLGPLGSDRPECAVNSLVARMMDTQTRAEKGTTATAGTSTSTSRSANSVVSPVKLSPRALALLPPLLPGMISLKPLPLPAPPSTPFEGMLALLPPRSSGSGTMSTSPPHTLNLGSSSVASPSMRQELTTTLDGIRDYSIGQRPQRPRGHSAGDGKYRLSKRFGQGSCGEVWRARLASSGRGRDRGDETLYILKRIFVERGEHVRLSGLREVFFGLRLRGQTHVARFVEYFEIVRAAPSSKIGSAATEGMPSSSEDTAPHTQRELWLVFHDEGSSLHSFLYYTHASDLIVQRSPFWQRMRTGGAQGLAVLRETMFQVLRGLSQVHSTNSTHRDIKPSNVIVRRGESRPVLKLADFGSSVVTPDPEVDSETRAARVLYGENGPSLNEETEMYQPPEVRLRAALQGAGSTPPPPFDMNRPFSYDLWSTGVLFLEMVLGTDKPFALQPRENAMIERALSKYSARVRTAVLLLHGLEEFCVVPDAHALSTWLVSLKKPLRKVKELIRKTGGRRVLAHGTSMMTKTFGDPERVEGSENKSCGHKDILRAILLRDPLGLGLEVFGADGKKIARLIGALLKWSPAERISAAEAAALPMFGDIIPA